MAKHVLSLEVPDTMNLCQMQILDTSIYSDIVPVVCPILEVTLPGFNYAVQFGDPDIAPGFNKIFTACDFEVQTSNCGTQFDTLPDGIYIIKYSVSPNDIVYVEYNHLRITKALNQYQSILCELDLAACEPDNATEDKLNKLRKIKMYLEAAKAKVERCHEPRKGMELYKYALKQLGKFECKSCQEY